ncbi:MAG: hypothetical protein JNK85_28770 [Verrucomicrobiales bacterium]|nr:hypothetical protein [Verrucomicrobiales bacterium]
MLAGSVGRSSAHSLAFEQDGFFYEEAAINYAAPIPVLPEVYQGEWPGDVTFPGLPSFASSAYDNTAVEITTFLEVDKADTYRFQLSADSIFKIEVGHQPPEALVSVLAPADVAGPLPAVPSVRDDPSAVGVFGPLPSVPLEADLVPALGTATNATPAQGCGDRLANAEAVAGHIVLVDRGACSFLEKVLNAAAAGAIAVVVANDRPDHPIIMGGLPNELPIPAFMIRQTDGKRLRSSSDVRLRLAPPQKGWLATRSRTSTQETSATSFEIQVGTPGRIPVRLITQILSTPANLEWMVAPSEGPPYLLNDPAMAATSPVRAYAQSADPPPPSIDIRREGPALTVRYLGVLQSSPSSDGPFTDEPRAPVSGFLPIDPSGPTRFFRARW